MKLKTKFEIGMKPWFINKKGKPEQSEYPITSIQVTIIKGKFMETPHCRRQNHEERERPLWREFYKNPWLNDFYPYKCFPTREDAIESIREERLDEIAKMEAEKLKLLRQIKLKKKETR